MDSTEAAERINRMWVDLAEQIAKAVPDIAMSEPVSAIQWATYAEACFWKATGEAATHDVKDVLPSRYTAGMSEGGVG